MDENRNYIYGKKLKKLRKLFQYSQKQCIEPLKLKRQQDLSELEKGRKYFTQQLLLDICRFFNVAYDDFTNFQNIDSFPNLETLTKINSAPHSNGDLHFEIQLLRKHLLIKELALVQVKQVIARRGMSHLGDTQIAKDVPIYVLV